MCSAVVCNGKGARLTQQTAVQQCRFDLAQFDAVSTDFHLEVLPSEEFHRAILPVHAEISGIIEPLSSALVCEEPLCGQNRIVQIAHGNAGSRDVQFSDDVRRTILHVLVENAESLSGQWIAVGYAAPGRFDFRHRIIATRWTPRSHRPSCKQRYSEVLPKVFPAAPAESSRRSS